MFIFWKDKNSIYYSHIVLTVLLNWRKFQSFLHPSFFLSRRYVAWDKDYEKPSGLLSAS